MKTIAISGASGFVGQSLVDFFSKQNYKVVQIKRDILNNSLKLDELINSSDVVINTTSTFSPSPAEAGADRCFPAGTKKRSSFHFRNICCTCRHWFFPVAGFF